MRILGLPEQFDLTMKCMIQNATQPLPDSPTLDRSLKPKFPFNLNLALLIEKYMCRIHKSLEDITGEGLPLDSYLKRLQKTYRDKHRVLPKQFCSSTHHHFKGLKC